MKRKIDYSVYLVTDRELMSCTTVEESVDLAIKGGATIVQLREKNLESLDFFESALRVRSVCDKYDVPLIINDRIDIALAVDAVGVHIGQSDIPTAVARRIIGADKILGVSVTNLNEAKKAKAEGADYLGVGAMFSTDTKKDAKVVTREELLEISNKVSLPIVIIGGINEHTIQKFKDVDIDGVAVVSAIIAKSDISGAAQEIKNLFLQDRRRIEHNIKGAIFDLDGTILDSMDVWENIDIEFLQQRGHSVPDGYINEICAKSFAEAAKYTKELFKLTESTSEIMQRWSDMATCEYSQNVKLLPYAEQYLRQLKEQGIKLAVATGLTKELYTPVLKANNIYDLFDVICSVDEVNAGKESPTIFNHTIGKMGLLAKECIVFEDLLPAISSAKQAGAVVYGVEEKYSRPFAKEIIAVADGYIADFRYAPIIKN